MARKTAQAHKREIVRNVLRLIGQTCNDRGRSSEQHSETLLQELCRESKIAEVIRVASFSWADFVLHTDCIVRRLDGTLVPIQVKSSATSAQRFIKKHWNSCAKKFGALPILMVTPPYGFYGAALQSAKETLLREIGAWRGNFQYEHWMLAYSPLFNFGCFQHLGHNALARIRIFQKQHPEYFKKSAVSPPS